MALKDEYEGRVNFMKAQTLPPKSNVNIKIKKKNIKIKYKK